MGRGCTTDAFTRKVGFCFVLTWILYGIILLLSASARDDKRDQEVAIFSADGVEEEGWWSRCVPGGAVWNCRPQCPFKAQHEGNSSRPVEQTEHH